MKEKMFFQGSLFTARALDKSLQTMERGWLGSILEKNLKLVDAVGFYSLYLWGLTAFVLGILMDCHRQTFYASVLGFCWLIGCGLFHYLAFKFLPILDKLSNSETTRLRSRAIPDCVAVAALVVRSVALVGIIWGIVLMFAYSQSYLYGMNIILGSLAVWGCADFAIAFSLRLETLSAEIDPELNTPETLIGLLDYGAKVLIKLVPVLWAILMFSGFVRLLVSTWIGEAWSYQPMAFQGYLMSVLPTVLLPVSAYFVYLVYMVAISLLRATFQIILGAAGRLR